MAASPTLRRRRLARELLRLRAVKGLTVDAVAKEAKKRAPAQKWSAAKVTRIENRKVQKIREADLLTLLDIYGVTDPGDRASLVTLAAEASRTGWWVGYKDEFGAAAYIDLETEATELLSYQLGVIPGLLQTPGYARAVIEGSGVTDPGEVDRRVEARMMRRSLLDRPDAPQLTAVIDEAALHKVTGSVLEEQIRHLLVPRPTVQVHVVPDRAGLHPALSGSFVVMVFPHDPSLVYLEQSISGMFLEEEPEIAHYGQVFSAVRNIALPPAETVAFLESKLSSDQK
ncbi:helix-turn-helix transcriptional regulator [Nocardiopsis sp. ATB16-24]|uniref:helix-turn-helix domain-containing protein n=1 Tax=Nocardiopsis sp. ATB16-24 TaxID=3019555 RepID=UPI0025542299|nr:helix-turn-helix transcriptional regulator [Nocardiopsis sp. ATB16-24]